MPKFIDLTGQRFGRLVVRENISRSSKKLKTKTRWLCDCDCGGVATVASQELRNGDTLSCHCLRYERLRAANITHGKSHKVREYNSWQNLLRRCQTTTHPDFYLYGGRGIKVCERWCGDGGFIAFLEDMGPSPGRGYSIDRLDVNGNYEPENCRWATQRVQMHNYRGNVWVEIGGRRQILSDWISELGLCKVTVYGRMRKGLSPKEALTRKPQKGKPLIGAGDGS